jgi:hypothetical protein
MFTNNGYAPFRRALACCAAALCLVALFPPRAAAWSDDGHKTVAVLAYRLLTPKARQNVDAVLQGMTVDAVVMWPDSLRYLNPGCVTPESPTCGKDYRPETARWHHVDLAYEKSGKYGPEVCPSTRTGDCVVAAIEDFRKILSGASRNKFASYKEADKRRFHDALRFMLHFVGDIHQPLHCANRNDDAGGNGLPVTWQGEPDYEYGDVWNLHSLWDDQMVRREMKAAGQTGFADYAAWLETKLTQAQKDYAARRAESIAPEQAESAAAWAEQSHRLAKKHAYDALPATLVDKSTKGKEARDFRGNKIKLVLLDEGYFSQGTPVVRQQLTLGGVRLARILNDTFDKEIQ